MKKDYFLTLSIFIFLASCATSEESKLRDSVAAVFSSAESINNVKICYNSALKRNPNLEGRTTINFKIDDQGHAKDINIVETRTNIKDPSLRDCLIHNVQSLKFPSADINDFTNVTFPFKLQRN